MKLTSSWKRIALALTLVILPASAYALDRLQNGCHCADCGCETRCDCE